MGRIVLSLENALSHFKVQKRTGNRIQAFCPAHDDTNASLSITISDDKILLFCHAGCSVKDILKSANLTFSDLFAKPPTDIYQYRNADGSFSHEKVKYKTPKGKTFTQRHIDNDTIVDKLGDIRRIPYNLPDVNQAIKQGSPILYVEGEKDADTAKLLGYTATTMGGASDWKDEYKNYFKNANVIQIPDKDDAGLKLAHKTTESLKTVAKSLKVLVLPIGKDLTEWVEAGNKDLNPLMNECTDLILDKGIPEPIMKEVVGGYEYYWNGLDLKIIIDHIIGEDAEIAIFDKDKPMYISGFRLLSISHKEALARTLKKQRNHIDWDNIINRLCVKTLTKIREGENVVWLDNSYGIEKPQYLLAPLFVKHAPNIIYADRSSAKSLTMTLFDILLTLPWHDNPLGLYISPKAENRVLYCDWENDKKITGWQKECLVRGTGVGYCDIPYLKCNLPLHKSVSHIQSKINEVNANVIIIDSLGLAVGDDLNLTAPAFTFFNTLRQLPVTPLIIAHTSKDINNKRKTVYGNAYYENLARSIWEVNKSQELGSNELVISLFNRKPPPFSSLSEPLGFRFTFEGDKISVEKTEPETDKRTENYDSEEPKPIDVIAEIIETSEKHLTPKDISKRTEYNENTVRSCCKRLKDNPKSNIILYDDGYGKK